MSRPLSTRTEGRAEQTSTLVHLRGLSKEFVRPRSPEPLRVLDDVSFDIARGEFIAIVGPSGCGKTTLLKILAGMTPHSGGTAKIGGGEMDASKIGVVFQQASLYPWRTVAANIAFGLELRVRAKRRRRKKTERQQLISELVRLVGLSGFELYYPVEISGGMQQRTNLARALAIEPELLLMDEPFSSLDAQTREDLQIEMQQIALAASTTVVFITHDIREAAYLADRVVVLSARPARVMEIVNVPTPRPRDFAYQVSDEFNTLTRHVWSLVHNRSGTPEAR